MIRYALILALAGCVGTPTIPQNADGKRSAVVCGRVTSVWGIATTTAADATAPAPKSAAIISVNGADCNMTITYSGAQAASAP